MMGRLYEFADVIRHHARQRHLTPDHALGRRGEDIAHRFLRKRGMTIVARNTNGDAATQGVPITIR